MSRLGVKLPWTSQPQYPTGIDRANPLNRGLKHSWSIIGGSNIFYRDAAGKANATSSTGSITNVNPLIIPGVGKAVSFDYGQSTPYGVIVPGSSVAPINNVSEFSSLVIFYLASTGYGSTAETAFWRKAADTVGIAFDIFPGSSDKKLRPLINTTGTTGWSGSYDVTVSDLDVGVWCAAFSYKSGSRKTYFGPLKNLTLRDTQTAITGDLSVTDANDLYIGGMEYTGANSFPGAICLVNNWHREVQGCEFAEIARNFSKIYTPITRNIYAPSAAGGNGAASGDIVFTSSIVGSSLNSQAASGNAVFTSSIVGASTADSSAAGDAVFTSSIVGASSAEASASGNAVFTSSIVGDSAVGGQGAASGNVVFTSSIIGASTAEASATGNIIFTASFVSDAPVTDINRGGGLGRSAKKRKYEKQHVWLVEIDDEEIQVDDLEEIQPIVKKKLAKGKTPTVKAKPLTENPREAATAYTEQDFLTQYVPMPVYDKRLDFVNILPYIIAMQKMEEEEDELLMLLVA